ncbi:hypothetical protein [Paraburkholderia sp. BCC1876]|uniref:hypothetical protein n=1 Tax=Paraburkholderia sp. BCC1876 TaxID=2676303 RepID=UPI0015910859|nr:hypothetical protein [Paraburkholderia sp. BCC1876]
MKTDLTQQRRIAAQALAEEAVEFGHVRGISRVVIEEKLGLHGNPLGQLLSEYLRGETAPSLAGLQRVENRLAAWVGRDARAIQVAEFDPSFDRFYEHTWDDESHCEVERYSDKAPPLRLIKLADAAPGVTSRELRRKMSEPDWPFVQVTADGTPLRPRCDPPAGQSRGKHAAGKLPEWQCDAQQDSAAASNQSPCNDEWLDVILSKLVRNGSGF